jgi:hypothetical protein
MRFRRIEKDTLGTGTEFTQGDKKTRADSKTYIGSNRKKKVDMNKIKNTKVGDDIHYYINGMEGRGIVVKMANEYLEIFKENGQLGTIHINDTFFVKDILINKQWDDMEDSERYDALMKIHAPSPRYITKTWSDMPEEIKVLLQKQMPGGAGSTYEKGETKDSETQDHARTGFAQNEQYSKKGDEEIIDWSLLKADDKEYEHKLRRAREKKEKREGSINAGNPNYYTTKNPKWKGDESKIPRPYVTTDFKTGKETLNPGKQKGYWHTTERKMRHARRQFHKDDPVKAKEWEAAYHAYDQRETLAEAARAIDSKSGKPNLGQRDTPTPKKDPPKKDEYGREIKPVESGTSGGFVQDVDDYKDKALYKQWLSKKVKRPSPRTAHGSFGTTQSEAGQEAQQSFSDATTSAAGALGADFGTATTKTHSGNLDSRPSTSGNPPKTISGDEKRRRERHEDTQEAEKSDVEHGKYSNPGGTPEVGVSTDTKVDVTTGTGYEERPHISVEEAGKLPRSTFNESGSELTVSGSQDSKDEPKFSQPHSQETVRKVGLPEQHPNTYGVRYGMKGGVKKVWCPEHQMWEETRKDWHE